MIFDSVRTYPSAPIARRTPAAARRTATSALKISLSLAVKVHLLPSLGQEL